MHKWGRGYATSTNFLDVDSSIFQSALQILQPEVVVLLLGTNDHNITGTGSAGYAANMTSLAARVRQALPAARLLMVSTVDSGVGRSQRLRQSYLGVLPAVAAASGAAYWDMATWFGPLKDNKDLAPDGLHVNEAGGAKIAAQLELEIAKAAKPLTVPLDKTTVRNGGQPPLPGLKLHPRLWLAADGRMALDGEGRVASWVDRGETPTRSGGVAQTRQPLRAARPLFVANAIGGKPAVRFDGKTNFVFLDFLDNGASTYVFVLRPANTDGALIGHSNAAIPSPDLLRGFAGELWVNGRKSEGLAPLPTGQPLVVTATPNGVTSAFLLGLAQSATNEAATDRYFSGDIAEFMAFYTATGRCLAQGTGTVVGCQVRYPRRAVIPSEVHRIFRMIRMIGMEIPRINLETSSYPDHLELVHAATASIPHQRAAK